MSEIVTEDKRTRLKRWLDSGKASLHPLTFPQRELWETSPVPVGDMANHICCVIEVRGKATVEDCTAAVRRVVQRQEALRVSFLPGKDRPLQIVRDDAPVNFGARQLASLQHSRACRDFEFDAVDGNLWHYWVAPAVLPALARR